MLTHRIECAHCGHRLKYGDEHAGRKAKCRKCRNSFLLPSPPARTEPSEEVTVELVASAPTEADHRGPEREQRAAEEIRTSCPRCSAEYEIAKRFVGRPVRCKGCNAEFIIEVDYDAQLAELERELVEQLLRASTASDPRDKGTLMAEAMSTLAKIGEVAAAAAPDRAETAREQATSRAFAEATARVKKIQQRRERLHAQRDLAQIEEGFDGSMAAFMLGLLLVAGVVVVALLSDVLYWGLGLIGVLLMLGGGFGAVVCSWAALEAFTRKHPLLRTVAKYAACVLLAVVLLGALVFAGAAIWRSFQS